MENRPTPLMLRARISNHWFEQILLGFLHGLSAQELIDAFEDDGDRNRSSPPSAKSIARIAAGIGGYIYNKIVQPALTGEGDDPGALLENVLAGQMPNALCVVTWEGETLDTTDELTRATKKLVQTRRSAYPDARSLLGRAALEAVFFTRAVNRKAQIDVWENSLALLQEQKAQIIAWLKVEPLDLAKIEREPNTSVDAVRLRHAGNPFIHSSKLSPATTQKLVMSFLLGLSAKAARGDLLANCKGSEIEPIPSEKTINKVFRGLGQRLFEQLYAEELEGKGLLPKRDGTERERVMEAHAGALLQQSLDALPYESFRIIHPEDDIDLPHPDMNIELRRIFARRKGMASDPMGVVALARFRVMNIGAGTRKKKEEELSEKEKARADLLFMHTMLCGWLIDEPLRFD